MDHPVREIAPDGATVHRGAIPARLVAPGTGFKEGRRLRLLPYGYVAHGAAAHPSAPLDAAVTVGPDGLVREIAVQWSGAGHEWASTVRLTALGATAAPLAPAGAVPLRRGR